MLCKFLNIIISYKYTSSYCKILKKNPFFIPDFSEDVHYEAELVVKINKVGKNIQEKFAHKYYNQLTVGLDFTARDIQQKQKEKGLPWETAQK